MISINRRQGVFLAFAVLVLLVVGILILAIAPSGRAGSSFDPSPWGTQKFYAYLQQQGFQVARWQRDYANLKGEGHVFIQISSRPIGWSPPLLEWLAQGNTLVRFYWHGEPTAAPFEKRLSTPQGKVLIETRRRVPRQRGDRPLLKDDHGSIVYLREATSPQTHGQRILGVYPWLVANVYGGDPPLRTLPLWPRFCRTWLRRGQRFTLMNGSTAIANAPQRMWSGRQCLKPSSTTSVVPLGWRWGCNLPSWSSFCYGSKVNVLAHPYWRKNPSPVIVPPTLKPSRAFCNGHSSGRLF